MQYFRTFSPSLYFATKQPGFPRGVTRHDGPLQKTKVLKKHWPEKNGKCKFVNRKLIFPTDFPEKLAKCFLSRNCSVTTALTIPRLPPLYPPKKFPKFSLDLTMWMALLWGRNLGKGILDQKQFQIPGTIVPKMANVTTLCLHCPVLFVSSF